MRNFPSLDLPLHHPVNLAYEAATADLDDVKRLTPSLGNLWQNTVNYNRDIEFPSPQQYSERILVITLRFTYGYEVLTWLVFAITDDEAAKALLNKEIIRRYYQTVLDFKNERVPETAVKKLSCS